MDDSSRHAGPHSEIRPVGTRPSSVRVATIIAVAIDRQGGKNGRIRVKIGSIRRGAL